MAASASAHQNALMRTVNPGDRVNIPCPLANSGGSIQFARDDQPITLDPGCSHCQLDISNEGQASLTISRISSRDAGHWQCWRLDSSGKVKQKIPIVQLVVSNSPELPVLIVNDKEILGGNGADASVTVKENELVTFKCLIRGASLPVDYVHWMLDSSQNVTHLSQLMMEYSPQEANYLTQSVLKLNATKQMNLKSISCLSNHHQWLTPMTVTALLNVLYEPSFTISREPGFGVPVTEGTTVILKCEIDSNPASSPIWIKDGDNKSAQATGSGSGSGSGSGASNSIQAEPIQLETQEDGSVSFQPAQRSDTGWYRCKTENKAGTFSSFGYYLNVKPATPPPQAAGEQASQRARSNSLAGGTAASSGSSPVAHPHAAGRFMAPNQPAGLGHAQSPQLGRAGAAMASSTNNLINDQPMGAPTPVSAPPFGSPLQSGGPAPFPALASASGPQEARCRNQRPDGQPEIEQPVSTVLASLGRPLVLPLRFCCNPSPARVFWIHRHLAMIPGRMFGPYITRDIYPSHNSFYCFESTFEIESVKPEDIGTVYVFVSNERGHAGAQINIQLSKGNELGSRFQLASASSGSLGSSLSKVTIGQWALVSSLGAIISLLLVAMHLSSPRQANNINR